MLNIILAISLITSSLFSIHSKEVKSISHQIKLSQKVRETSGLIYYQNDVWTINDSGDKANLYRISLQSGEVIQTIHIQNAKNIDWEDIAQDDDYIYIGDTGNNRGNKNTFRIYQISKKHIPKQLTNCTISAEIITFQYEDQGSDLLAYQHDFDCEALISINGEIGLFSKNWASGNTNYYIIDKSTGTANKKATFASSGVITAADYDVKNDIVFLTSYQYKNDSFFPYLVCIKNFSTKRPKTEEYQLEKLNHFQVEGVCIINNEVFISNEETSHAPPSIHKVSIKQTTKLQSAP
ncbi:hypothetical protein [Carboxylicivirga sp. N1Y90]|uniref:hypothetical protein n=1 Tax=Carboxylicivirga fragile TaxID=3417571 RepID=UPI003D34EC52|nr:hypothetical protein [Marinilabiliaceae bacterium N1Y90]